jgi:hypothetical protein
MRMAGSKTKFGSKSLRASTDSTVLSAPSSDKRHGSIKEIARLVFSFAIISSKSDFNVKAIGYFCHIFPVLPKNEKGIFRFMRKKEDQAKTTFRPNREDNDRVEIISCSILSSQETISWSRNCLPTCWNRSDGPA